MGLREIALILTAGLGSAGLIVLLRPVLVRYALARPNARSSHKAPTPQGGGVAVIIAAVGSLAIFSGVFADAREALGGTLPLGAAVILLTIVGGADDIFALGAPPRLALQAIAVLAVVATMPAELRAVELAPLWAERTAEFFAGLWFVNLVNFMDGIDWMTTVETVPITASIFWFSLVEAVPQPAALIALALLGAMLGFAPSNRPVAKLFLGDVGSLPIGLVLFWLLLLLATSGHLVAAVLLPLYSVADATITLLRRLARGERITEAHRSHFYQIAVARGVPVIVVVRFVFMANVGLALLADAAIRWNSVRVDVVVLLLGGVLVAALLLVMAKGRR